MDTITIIKGTPGDGTVIKNGRAILFDPSDLLPDPAIWAIQWNGESGEIEYSDERDNEVITDITPFANIIAEFDRLATLEDNEPVQPLPDATAQDHIESMLANPGVRALVEILESELPNHDLHTHLLTQIEKDLAEPQWTDGETVSAGSRRRYNGLLWKAKTATAVAPARDSLEWELV